MGVTRINIRRNSDNFEARRSRIFSEILNLYIQTALPVGSRTIARRLRNSLSPATIRNVMADLEELGYIGHPYTSAGRVPTDQGYRYYVDDLMERIRLTQAEEQSLRAAFEKRHREVEEIIVRTSQLLSELSHQASMVLFSGLAQDTFKRIALIPLDPSSNRLLVVFVTGSGLVHNYKIELESPLDEILLGRLTRILNQELEGMPLSQVEPHLKRKILMERDSLYYLFRQAMEIIKATILTAREERLWMEGASHVLEQPEFHDIDRTRSLLRLMEERETLLQLLRQELEQEVKCRVYIGSEMESAAMSGYSLITCSYKVGDRVLGVIGMLGPTRMEYPRAVALVDQAARMLGNTISRMGGL